AGAAPAPPRWRCARVGGGGPDAGHGVAEHQDERHRQERHEGQPGQPAAAPAGPAEGIRERAGDLTLVEDGVAGHRSSPTRYSEPQTTTQPSGPARRRAAASASADEGTRYEGPAHARASASGGWARSPALAAAVKTTCAGSSRRSSASTSPTSLSAIAPNTTVTGAGPSRTRRLRTSWRIPSGLWAPSSTRRSPRRSSRPGQRAAATPERTASGVASPSAWAAATASAALAGWHVPCSG